MRVAVIGAGIAGLACAWRLRNSHDVTIFEADGRPGGHAHTVKVHSESGARTIDTGFVVFNRPDYPCFSGLLDELDVAVQPTTMSFSVHDEGSGREYCATESINRLFAQRSNLVRPDFWRMLSDIVRFYRQAPALLQEPPPGPTLGDFLVEEAYSTAFRDLHLLPMASALWSAPLERVGDFPARSLVGFMKRHSMLQFFGRPQWLTVKGGSSQYVSRIQEQLGDRLQLCTPVRRVHRNNGVRIQTDLDQARFDAVVMACHTDQALEILADASEDERRLLGAIRYQSNDVVLHEDTSLLPRRRRAWASWNYRLPAEPRELPLVTYHMNTLQSLDTREQYCVTLNGTDRIDPTRILGRFRYAHPQFDHAAVEAQKQLEPLQGVNDTWYCGAWTSHGFHEDGAASGMRVAARLAAS